MQSIFTVQTEDLSRLTPEEAVKSFRNLLWSEARRLGIPVSQINIPDEIYVKDGGIDALVVNSTIEDDLIRKGKTAYQIKTGNEFNPSQDAQIKGELFGKQKPVSLKNLKSRIKNCLDENGTYILVCFGIEIIDRDSIVKKILGYLTQVNAEYKNAKIEVWGQNQLLSFFSSFPSLSLQLTDRINLPFQSHKSWSQDALMDKKFEMGPEQELFIENLRTLIRDGDPSVQIRITGDPGIGKTRSVLEATSVNDLSPSVIYCSSGEIFEHSLLMYELLREDNRFFAILVLDDCDEQRRSRIWNKLKARSNRIRVITITNEEDRPSSDVGDMSTPVLERKYLSLIIQSYDVPSHIAEIWASECAGFPRVAHIVGSNLKDYPEDPFRSQEIDRIWDRFIAGLQDVNSTEVKERTRVLRHLALFRKFGLPVGKIIPMITEESKMISKMIMERTGIREARLLEIIKGLRERKILQGENTLQITPKLLHIKLWSDYWETYGPIENIEQFAFDLPESLFQWFQEMFEYAKTSPAAYRVVEQLLGKEGIYKDVSFLNSSQGASFFLTLSKASPHAALRCLHRILGHLNRDSLLEFGAGRRQIVWALERMAEWKELFPDAATLLLKLGEAENENYANNASGIFVDLFSSAYGEIAPSEAGPELKLPILKQALASGSKEQRLLALKACDRALEIDNFSRLHGTFAEPFHPNPNRWMPKTYKEWFDGFRGVWILLSEIIDDADSSEQEIINDIILRRAFGIGKISALADMAIETLKELLAKSSFEKITVLAHLRSFLWRDDERRKQGMEVLLDEVRGKWDKLNEELAPTDFKSRLERYIATDLLEDKYSEETGFSDDQTKPIFEDLATQVTETPELLESELGWLMTGKAKRAYDFGYEIGRGDDQFKLLPILIRASRENRDSTDLNLGLLGGYFRALRERSENFSEAGLDLVSADLTLKRFVAYLTEASGLTERGAQRIIQLLQEGIYSFAELGRFQYGLQIRNITQKTLGKWLKFLLLQTDAYAVNIALNYLQQYYVYQLDLEHKPKLPKTLAYKALTHKALFDESQSERFDQMGEHYWLIVANRYLSLYPDRALNLAKSLIHNLENDGPLYHGLDRGPSSILTQIARSHPSEVWKMVSKRIAFPIDKKTMRIKFWLDQGGPSFGSYLGDDHKSVPLEELWEWIDADVEQRALFAAWFLPSFIFKNENGSSPARELLIRYGHREDVKKQLKGSFGSTKGAIMGPLSEFYQNRLDELNRIKENEDNPIVLAWLEEATEDYERIAEEYRIHEEREF